MDRLITFPQNYQCLINNTILAIVRLVDDLNKELFNNTFKFQLVRSNNSGIGTIIHASSFWQQNCKVHVKCLLVYVSMYGFPL